MKPNQTLIQSAIITKCDEVKEMLLEKNRKYGNAIFEPIGVLFKGNPLDGHRFRIDEKIKRLQSIGEDPEGDDEDTIDDLIGHLILYKIAKELV